MPLPTMRWTRRLLPVAGATALLVATVLPAMAQDEDASFDLQAGVEETVGLLNGGIVVVTIHDGEVATAAAGIANEAGNPLTVDTPMLLWSPAALLTHALALSLVDEGLLDLDAAVTDYLPDAPVGEGATVRNLLESRAGTPSINEAIDELVTSDPDRTWTTDSMLAQVDPAEIGPVGELEGNYTDTLLTIQLIEAVTGVDYATALDERIVQPLDLAGTVHAEGDFAPPADRAGGWSTWFENEAIYMTDDWEAARSSRPAYSTAADLASFIQALLEGEVVSRDLLAETMLREDLGEYGYSLIRTNDELFPASGPLGEDYYGSDGARETGTYALVAFGPTTGDVLVTMTNNHRLIDETRALAKDIVRSWAGEDGANAMMNEAQMEFRFVMGTFTCDVGQAFPFDYPPCEANETEMVLPFELPFEMTGTFEGSGVESGTYLLNLEAGTFTYTATGVFMGEVEGCGYGTMFFRVDDGAGFQGEVEPNYTQGTAEILPGGTLPLAGSFELVGIQDSNVDDGTASVDVTGSYFCEGVDA